MLIGQDQSDLTVTHEFRTIIKEELFVSRCLLGWSIHGHYKFNDVCQVYILNKKHNEKRSQLRRKDIYLDNLVKFYFEFDSVGVNSSPKMNKEDARAVTILEQESRFVNDHREVGLLRKSDELKFSNGREIAMKRLNHLDKRFERDAKYKSMYEREIQRLFDNGFAEIIEQPDKVSGQHLRYIPHFSVHNVNKPDRLRVVHDAAVKIDSNSFNDLMLTGPVLLKPLFGVIMRFRQFKVGIKSDMKDMFMKIKLRQEDRDAQRFLWKARDSEKIIECLMSSMLFRAKSSPFTALFIKNKNASTFSSNYLKASNCVINNIHR